MPNLGERPERLLRFIAGAKLPLILQTEVAECGIACLAMVAGYYGLETDMVNLRRRFAVSVRGSNMEDLSNIATALHLGPRVIKVEIDQLAHLQKPCILHWEMNHFVVLKSVTRNTITIHDPARGSRRLSIAEFRKGFTGIAMELYPTEDFEIKDERNKLKLTSFWSSISGIKRTLLSIFLFSILLQIFGIISALYMQIVLDDVLLREDVNYLFVLATGFFLLLIIETFTSTFRELLILRSSNLLSMQMSANLFRHLIRLPMEYFLKRHMGDIVSRFSSLNSIRELFTVGLVSVLVDGLMASITLVVMFLYNVELTIFVLFVVLAYALIRIALYQPLKTANQEAIVARAKHDTYFMETMRAIQTIKIFRNEVDRQNLWHNRLANSLNKNIVIARWNIRYGVIYRVVSGIENIVVIYLGALAVMNNDMSVGMLLAFVSFKTRFVSAMEMLIARLVDIKMLDVHLARLSDITHTPMEKLYNMESPNITSVQMSGDHQSASLGCCIEVKNLSFRYSDHEPYIFKDLNFTIESGEVVAFTGASGCGKTTLLKCIMGLVKPTDGEIKIDGVNLNNIDNYRDMISGVMQEDTLLAGSIADNIAFFSSKPDEELIRECAGIAKIHDDISNMAMDYNTLVGDMGSGLSGGQCQRIMLARALYKKPKILFMDEATSHLDVSNEKLINQNIRDLAITRVFVAHRPETIKFADRIIELD